MKYFFRALLTFMIVSILATAQLEDRLESLRLLAPMNQELNTFSESVNALAKKRQDSLLRSETAKRIGFSRIQIPKVQDSDQISDSDSDQIFQQIKVEERQSLVLGLFPDLEVEVIRTKTITHPNQIKTWVGHVRSDPYSFVVLSFDPRGLVGYLNIHGQTFSISPMGEGLHLISENKLNKLGGTEPDSFPPPTLTADPAVKPLADTFNDGTFVDIMGLYSATALSNDPSIVTTITNIIAATNESLAKSCVKFRLRLVHTGLSSHDESISGGNLLNCMADATDGCLDDIPALRATHGADIVSMFQWAPTAVGYIPSIGLSNPAAGFNALGLEGGLNTESFLHEFGHNMGINHDRYSEDVSLHDYADPKGAAYDYIDTANGFSTNTSRGSSCYYSELGCFFSGYYSNPRVLRYGHPMGIPGISDGVSIANQMAVHLANYAQAITDHDPDLSGCQMTAEAPKSSPQCFISTAAFGSSLHPYVEDLRIFRDRRLNSNELGKTFVEFYYRVSPGLAALISNNPSLQLPSRMLLAPMIWFILDPLKASLVALLALVFVLSPSLVRRFR